MANHRYGRIKLALAGFTAAAVLAGASFLQPSGSSTSTGAVAADAVTISYQSNTAATTAATTSAATTAAATSATKTTTTTATTAKTSKGS